MRLLKLPLFPLILVLRLLLWPIRLLRRNRAAKKNGWIELELAGEVVELYAENRISVLLARLLRREEPPKIALASLRRLVNEIQADAHVRGILVRLGTIEAGWAAAKTLRDLLYSIRQAEKQVIVYIATHAGNRELLVASAANHIWMGSSGALAGVGASSHGLFFKESLQKLGVTVEVAAKGRFKSAPERFTRKERSPTDREQTKTLIDTFDEALLYALEEGRKMNRDEAVAFVDRSPIVGVHAHEAGYCDALVFDETIPRHIQTTASLDAAPDLQDAAAYLKKRTLPPIWRRREKIVGIVEVHGAIVDHAPRHAGLMDQSANRKSVVDDLRAALEDSKIGAVVLHVNSRGGSVTASDAIYAMVARVNEEKPVIACMGDVAASGGYYVACGARTIVAHPLTITGSIGVFAMLPTWPELTERLALGHDTVQNRQNATLYNPWVAFTDEAKAHANREVEAMYQTFLSLVAKARKLEATQVAECAEGRVWSGKDAQAQGLVDDLGGFARAVDLAKEAAGGRFASEPRRVKVRGERARPAVVDPQAAIASTPVANLASLVATLDPGSKEMLSELLCLLPGSRPVLPWLAYSPLWVA